MRGAYLCTVCFILNILFLYCYTSFVLALYTSHCFELDFHPYWSRNWTQYMMENSLLWLYCGWSSVQFSVFLQAMHSLKFFFQRKCMFMEFSLCVCMCWIYLFTKTILFMFHLSLVVCILNYSTDHYPQHSLEVSLCLWIVLLKDDMDACVGVNAF